MNTNRRWMILLAVAGLVLIACAVRRAVRTTDAPPGANRSRQSLHPLGSAKVGGLGNLPANPSLPPPALVPESKAGSSSSPADCGPLGNLQLHRRLEEAPVWTVKFGKEFWRRPVGVTARRPASKGSPATVSSSLDFGDVVDRVSHAINGNSTASSPSVTSGSYTAAFDGEGLRFSPHRPAFPSSPTADPGAEAVIRTVLVRCGDQPLYEMGRSRVPWSVLGNTAQALLAPAVGLVEHYEARSGGVELTWILPQPLSVVGPLVVESEITGVTYAGQTQEGLHFADATGTARVVVGNIRVVDAVGHHWEATMESKGDRLRVTVPSAILTEATYPVAIDPQITAEFGMDKRFVIPRADDVDRLRPSVAFDGSRYLVVWRERPKDAVMTIRGAYVDPDGSTIDPAGFYIALLETEFPLDTEIIQIGLASNGRDFLVVWNEIRFALIDAIYYRIHCARISGSGPADIHRALVTEGKGFDHTKFFPSVAGNPQTLNYLIAWEEGDHDYPDIYGRIVGPAGLGDIHPLNSATDTDTIRSAQQRPAVAALGSGFMVAFLDYRGVYGQLVDSSGTAQPPLAGFPIRRAVVETSDYPKVASDGLGRVLVVWTQNHRMPAGSGDIYGNWVDANGGVTDPNGFPITSDGKSRGASVACNSSQSLVVWKDNLLDPQAVPGNIYGAVLQNRSLQPSRLTIVSESHFRDFPVVVSDGQNFLVAWEDFRHRANHADIYGTIVIAGERPADQDPIGFAISGRARNNERHPALASNGKQYLVVWEDNGNPFDTGRRLHGVFVDFHQRITPPGGIDIGAPSAIADSPAVTSDGQQFLVTWHESSPVARIAAALVSDAGQVAPDFLVSDARSAQAPGVAWDGAEYLAVWQDQRNRPQWDIYGCRLARDGTRLDPSGIPIADWAGDDLSPAVAGGDNAFLVVWASQHNGNSDIYGKFVARIPFSLPNGNSPFPICPDIFKQVAPAIAFNGSRYLVVWEDSRNGGWDIFGTDVDAQGNVASPEGQPIWVDPNIDRHPVVAADGGDFLVVWQEQNDPVTTGIDILGSRVRITGPGNLALLEPDALPIDTLRDDQQAPAVASFYGGAAGSGQYLVVNQSLKYGTARAVGNFVIVGSPWYGPPQAPHPISALTDASIRELIDLSNDGDTIMFEAGVGGTLTLTNGELVIDKNLSIVGPGAAVLTISGAHSSRVFRVTSNATVHVSNLTIADGAVYGGNGRDGDSVNRDATAGLDTFGAGIYNEGHLILTDCAIVSCLARGGNGGQGLADQIDGPPASGAGGWGAGGGVYNAGILTVVNCAFTENAAEGGAGGAGATCRLPGCSGGTGEAGGAGVGGAIFNSGTLRMTNCTVGANSVLGGEGGMGGIGYLLGGSGGSGGNGLGGGVADWSEMTLLNCTIADNAASRGAGSPAGICDRGGGERFACNPQHGGNGLSGAGGIYVNLTKAPGQMQNTIVARNSAGDAGADLLGRFLSGGHNLIGQTNASSGWTPADLVGSIAVPLDPGLGPLQYNGGQTRSYALLDGSQARDGGDDFVLSDHAGPTDQRNRPRRVGPHVDIGAFESGGTTSLRVISRAGAGAGSLRQSIADAYDGDTIQIGGGIQGKISLGDGELFIQRSIHLAGPGAANVVLSGEGSNRVVQIAPGARVSLSGVTIANGSAREGGGILNNGTLTMNDCVLSNNVASASANNSEGGGGILNRGTLTLNSSTLVSNRASYGAGLLNAGTSRVASSTFSGNRAEFIGGGIYHQAGALALKSCTIVGNHVATGGPGHGGGGLYTGFCDPTHCVPSPPLAATVGNSILAGNSAAGGADCQGPVTSEGYNLVGDGFGSRGFGNRGDQISLSGPIDAMLGPLQDNGGPTPTMAPLFGSPAIDRGDLELGDAPWSQTSDQRGQRRSSGARPDIGAVEVQRLGTTWTVHNTNDSGAGSLREAVASSRDDDTIAFAPDVTGVITLAGDVIEINRSIRIIGPGADQLTVSGDNRFRIFYIYRGYDMFISGLTLADGRVGSMASGSGQNTGCATGGAICTFGNLTLLDCVVRSSAAIGGQGRDGIDGVPGSQDGRDGACAEGGAIYNELGTLTLIGCTISSNSARGGDGGAGGDGNNSAGQGGRGGGSRGGGIYNLGTLRMTNCTLAYNGAWAGRGGSGGDAAGANSTGGMGVDGGLGSGGALFNGNSLSLQNCTFSSNQAVGGVPGTGGNGGASRGPNGVEWPGQGAGVHHRDTFQLSPPYVDSCLFADNDARVGPDWFGSVVSGGYNLITRRDDSFGFGGTDLLGTRDAPLDARLGSLQNNGGPTPTMALLSGSPAVDAGDDSVVREPAKLIGDQRGFLRWNGNHVDAGAYEADSRHAFIVINTADSDPGSLRQAILDANASPGPDTILFRIPGIGVQTIAPQSPLPDVTETATIDGYTQPGSAENTLDNGDNAVVLIELNGASAGANAMGLRLAAPSCIVRGLAINRFGLHGIHLAYPGGNVVAGNFIGVDATGAIPQGNGLSGIYVDSRTNLVGGASPAARNLISANGTLGIILPTVGCDQNVIQGNFIGTDATGTAALGNNGGGLGISNGASNTIGGTLVGEGNLISGNGGGGLGIAGSLAQGNVAQGNRIGTGVSGEDQLGNGGDGVQIFNAPNNLIGGATPAARNVISGNNGSGGIEINGADAMNNLVQGNFVGMALDGETLVPNRHNGVLIHGGATGNLIGGTTAGAGNRIAGNSNTGTFEAGILLYDRGTTNNALLGNSVFGNGGLGIDLGGDGVTPNDRGDGDDGPNHLQNSPVLTSVATHGTTLVQGMLKSTPNTTFRVEFFSNRQADPSGFGEGETFLIATSVTTDGNGHADFGLVLPDPLPSGHFVTATATHPQGNTSEFSRALQSCQAGTLDATLNDRGLSTYTSVGRTPNENDVAQGIAIQPDGKILLAGTLGPFPGTSPAPSEFGLVRLNPDGNFDLSFGIGGVTRKNFNTSASVRYDGAKAVVVQSDGKILVTGPSYGSFAVARYNSDGSFDPSFGGTGVRFIGFGKNQSTATTWADATALAVRPDGKILIAGAASLATGQIGTNDFALAQLNPDGSLDTTFGPDHSGKVTTDFFSGDDAARAVALQPDGKALVVGYAYNPSTLGPQKFALVRYNVDGSIDVAKTYNFNDASELCFGVAIRPDGKILMGGFVGLASSATWAIGLLRLNPDCKLDPSFGQDGKTALADSQGEGLFVNAITLQSDGKIVVVGSRGYAHLFDYKLALARFDPDGSPDPGFGPNGTGVASLSLTGAGWHTGTAVALDGDGRILAAGGIDLNPPEFSVGFLVTRWCPGEYPMRGQPWPIPGTIEGEDYDNGGPEIAYSDTTVNLNEAGGIYQSHYRPGSGVDLETDGAGGSQVHIAYIHAGEWLQYTVDVAASGVYRLDARVSSSGDGGTFHVELDGGDVTGPLTIPNTGGYLSFETIAKAGVALAAGRHLLRVAFDSNGANGVFVGNLDYLQFSADTPPRLSITRSGNEVMVSWPASALGFRLQVAGSLNLPIFWTDVGQTPTLMTGRLTATVLADQTERFYRLIAP